ncbi:MAG TPA: cysteine desulfurase [Methanomassiliicoccales archaeon]|jgi:cysteine desulfurase/selenocysteine lyase
MDIDRIRGDFPILSKGEKSPVYLDTACQSLRPRQVVEAMDSYYYEYPACGGRSVHRLATQVSIKVDEAREKISDFIGSDSYDQVIFTKNATESINLIARGLGLKKGDAVLTTDMEHNSNHVPWLLLKKTDGVDRVIVDTPEDGSFDLEALKQALSKKVRLVSVVQTNNVTGTTIPVKEICEISHDNGSLVMVDGAQSAPHMKVDMEDMDVDFFAFSMHKMLGPSGVGVLYGKKELLDNVDPLIVGGGGVSLTTYDKVDLLPIPERFESGLLNYAGIIGSGTAVDYLRTIGMDDVMEHDIECNRIVTEGLAGEEKITVIGPEDPESRGSIYSFNISGMRSHDVAMILDEMSGIMIRSGMHCVHPFFLKREIDGAARASFYLYTSKNDCERFVQAVKETVRSFAT